MRVKDVGGNPAEQDHQASFVEHDRDLRSRLSWRPMRSSFDREPVGTCGEDRGGGAPGATLSAPLGPGPVGPTERPTSCEMKPRRRQLASIAVMALASSACLDLPPIQYETEKAVIGTDFDAPLCPHDLDRIDRQIAFVEDMLGAASDEKIEIYIYSGQPPRCYGGISCYDTRRNMVRTHWGSLEHEVVHAVVARFAEPTVFWSEGIATALDGNGTFNGVASVVDSSRVDDTMDLDYATAGHFVRWLLEEHDPMKIRPVLEGTAFESVYGMPFPDAASQFEREQPFAYPPWFPCDYPPLDGADGEWGEKVEIGCGTPGGSSTEGGPFSVLRTVELEPGSYEIQTQGGLGTRLLGCQTDVFETEPAAMFHGDVPNQVESSQTHPGVLFESGSRHEFELVEPGLFKVVIMAREPLESATVTLRRTPDP